MGNFNYTYGLGHVPSFQTSARPYLSSSLTIPANTEEPLEIQFDSVSKFIIITNTLPASVTNVPLRFGFSANGISGSSTNYAILNNGESFEADFRVTSVFLLSDTANEGSGSVVAGLTGIHRKHLEDNWSGSSGVG